MEANSPRELRPVAPYYVLVPSLASIAGCLGFSIYLLRKWTALEELDGGPLHFSQGNLTEFVAFSNSAEPTWAAVMAPTIFAEIVALCFASASLAQHRGWRTHGGTRNTTLHHTNSLVQSALSLLGQGLLVLQLSRTIDSWLAVFAPLYMAVLAQLVLHYQRNFDSRGRRPGSPVVPSHLVGVLISFKMIDAFHYAEVTWASVLWPVWLLGSGLGVLFLIGLCCGIPMLMRREGSVRLHLACMSSVAVLVVCAVVFPSCAALVRLVVWLDGTPLWGRSIVLPFIVSCSLLLGVFSLAFCTVVAVVAPHAARAAREGGEADDPESLANVASLLAQLPTPVALVRESSTLFRRASSDTTDKYRLHKQEEAGAEDGAASGPNEIELGEIGRGSALERMERGRVSSREVEARGADGGSAERRCRHGDADDDADADADADAAAAAQLPSMLGQPLPAPPNSRAPEASRSSRDSGGGGGGATPEPSSHAALLESTPLLDELPAAASVDATAPSAPAEGEAAEAAAPAGERSPRLDGKDDTDDPEASACWICLSGPSEAVLLECGHGGICNACAERCARKRPPLCPMCRAPITHVVRLAGPEEAIDGEMVVTAR